MVGRFLRHTAYFACLMSGFASPLSAQDDASPSTAPRGGVIQQFKSFTSNLFGGDKDSKAAAVPQPPPLEAQNRRILPPVIQGNRGRNGNNQRGRMNAPTQAPPSHDPPSLPPIQSAQKYRQLPATDDAIAGPGTKSPGKASKDASAGSESRSATGSALDDNASEDEFTLPTTQSISKSQSSRRAQRPTYVSTDAATSEEGSEAAAPLPIQTPDGVVPETNAAPVVPRKQAAGAVANKNAHAPNHKPAASPEAGNSTTLRQPKSNSNTMIQMGLPHVELALNGSTSLRVNEFCNYELIATNRDQIQLNGLIVRVGLPASVQVQSDPATANEVALEKEEDGSISLIWQIEQLAPTQTKGLKFNLRATQPEHFALDIEWTALPQAAQATMQVSQPVLQLALEGPAEVRFGSPEIYRLRVKNPGNASVQDVDVTLTADQLGGNSSNIGDIPAGGERLIEVELTFQHAGQIPIVATAKSATSGLETSSQIDIQVQKAELVAEWLIPDKHYQGSLGEYRIRLANQGNIVAENLSFSVTVPPSAEVISIPDGARVVGREIQWNAMRMEPGATSESTFEIRMDQAGEFPLQFRGQGSCGADTTVETVTHVDAISDLKLSVIDPPAPAPLGRPVTYEIVVKNRGSKTATGVRVLAQFSNGIEPVDAKGHTFQLVPGQVLYDPIPEIAPGEERVLRVQATASEQGMHRFRTEITCDDTDTQLLHEASTRYLATGRIDGQNGTIRR